MTRTTAEARKRIARRFPEQVATEGRIDVVDEICAEDVVDHNPLGTARGRDELRDHVEDLHAAFDDVAATVEDVLAEGDLVAMRVTLEGVHVGEFLGVEPTDREFEITNHVFTRVEDGRIVERWVLADVFGLLRQLGAVERPGE